MNDRQKITLTVLEDHLRAVLDRVKEMSTEIERMASELKSDEEKARHLEGTIQYLREISVQEDSTAFSATNASAPLKPIVVASDPLPFEKLRGLSQPRAMIVIAKHFEGYLRPKQLADALIASKLMRRTQNSNSIASRLIRESERFEKIAEGLYKLKAFEVQTQVDAESVDPSNLSRILQ